MQSLLRLKAVMAATGRSRSAIYQGISEKSFPASIKISARSVAWLESEIAEWQEQRIAQSRQKAKMNDHGGAV